MTIETKFDGEALQFGSKATRLTEYLNVVLRSLKPSDTEAARFLMETTVVMIVAFLDHYLSSVISTATFAREADVRIYLRVRGNEEEQRIAATCSVGQLRSLMTRRANLLAKDGRRLDATFQFLFGFSVWPDDAAAAALVRDFARLRNLIVHHGGYPTKVHFDEMETAGLITEASKELQFYRMNLATAAPTILEGVKAIGALVTRLQANFLADERWLWRGPLEQLPLSITEQDVE